MLSNLEQNFKEFYNSYCICSIERAIEYYAIFAGAPNFCKFDARVDIFENINSIILNNFREIRERVDEFKLSKDECKLLQTIAQKDNRELSAIKKSNINSSKNIYNSLISKNILHRDFSREIPIKKSGKEKLKKEFRKYKIQHILRFNNNFIKFYFTFIYPYTKELEDGKTQKVLNNIKLLFEKFVSSTYEELANIVVFKYFGDIRESGRYWSRFSEIDILALKSNGDIIIGECKWKNSKICQNILNNLIKKGELEELNPSYYLLFSKSGFSNQLLNLKDKRVKLFDNEELLRWILK